jgi:uncharacterized protein YjiS (DUF1127 family)
MTGLRATDPLALLTAGPAAGTSLPPLSRLVLSVARNVVVWESRHRTRRALARLDQQILRDIGLSEVEAAVELEKPFWRA